MRAHVERGDKYEVGEEFVVPDVAAVAGGKRAESLDLWLVNTYFDTPDGALRRCWSPASGALARWRVATSRTHFPTT